ncbi:hypothetical protein M406DRAFT_219554, partial [Cryphonectria parasitica EP155]
TAPKPKPTQNPALRMMGLPALPRKLPSRNWLIFWTLAGTLTGAIIYDRREKRRATARWAHAVSHLAKEPIPGGNPSAMPRKLTIYLEAPPGDGLRVAQDHFREYVKPVLAASGLDWEFRQGRQQGDIRAVVAEEVRKRRRRVEKDIGSADAVEEGTDLPTDDDFIENFRRQHGIPDYDGVRGDIVIGRHTWKEYIRGLHEGWLGPLKMPLHAQPDPEPEKKREGDGEEQENKTKRPRQPKPYNSVDDYATAHLPLLIPAELAPSAPISFPHILGFLNTPTRFYRFLTRRRLADEIGAEVAAVCFATYRDFREVGDANSSDMDQQWEQQTALVHEEQNWLKSVWKSDTDLVDGSVSPAAPAKEKIWPRPVVLDPRIAMRMRRFELLPEDEQRARAIVVPEEEVEGWIKGSLRSLWRWATDKPENKKNPIP